MKKVILKILFLMAIFMNPSFCFAQTIVTNQGPAIDLTKKADLIIDFKTSQNDPLIGAQYHIYKVADMGEYGVSTSALPFNNYDLNFEYLDEEGWNDLTQQLAEIIKKDNIQSLQSGKTDTKGELKFDSLPLGLYLVIGDTHIVGASTYNPQVFLINLPNMLEQDVWEYSVRVYPKYSYDLDTSKIVNKKVEIVWDDVGFENRRPKNVTIELYKDGKKYDEVVLNINNNWSYIWKDIDDSYEWNIVEIIDERDYIVWTIYENNAFTITNSYRMSLPATGMLWWPVPILFISGSILFLIGVLVRDKEDEEE